MTKSVASSFGTFTDKELDTLKKGLSEMSNLMTMMDANRDAMKEIIGSLYDELKIPKKIIRRMGKTYHKQNYSEVTAENQDFELLYEGISPEVV